MIMTISCKQWMRIFFLVATSVGTIFPALAEEKSPAGQPELQLPEVKVRARTEPGELPKPYAGGQVARGGRLGFLGNRDVFDTPFNTSSFTETTIKNQQAQYVADVLDNDPSTRLSGTRYGNSDAIAVRGFFISALDIGFDGLYGLTGVRRNSIEGLERVEIIKGPSALLNGVPPNGGIGGRINFVPKRALDTPTAELTATFSNRAQLGTHVDVGRRFGADNALGVRLNLVYRDGDTPIERQSEGFGVAALGLDYRGDHVRITADLGYDRLRLQSALNGIGLAAGIGVPPPPRNTSNFEQPWGYVRNDRVYGAVRGEFDVRENVTLSVAYGRAFLGDEQLRALPTIVNANGNFRILNGRTQFNLSADDNDTAEATLRAVFDTGPVKHALTLGASGLWKESRSRFRTLPSSTIVSNIYNPVFAPEPNLSGVPRERRKSGQTRLTGIAVADTLSFLQERILLTAGFRVQQIKVERFNTETGVRTALFDRSKLTPGVGLVVKPYRNLSLYANYIEGLREGPTAPAAAVNANQAFPPLVSKQREIGAKVDFGQAALTLSAYELTQPSGITNPVTNVFNVDGKQRNRGVELQTFGEPYRGFRLLGGIALLDAELTKTQGGVNDGKRAPSSPRKTLNLGTEVDAPFLPGLTLTGRAIATGSQFLDQANTLRVADWTRFDIGARYTFKAGGHPVTVRADVHNVTGRDYWDATGASLTPGLPRIYLLSVSIGL